MIRKLRQFLPFFLALVSASVLAEPAGSLVATEGTVFVVKSDGKKRIVAPGSSLEKGDAIQTERDSTAKLRFSDGSEMVIRPNSSMLLQDYNFQDGKPEQDSFVLGLIRGGLRQITGLIGKRGNQNAFQMNGSTATIGIRGTDFTARVCQANDCEESGNKPAKAPRIATSPVIAKVMESKGKVTALQVNGLRRDLAVDGSIYQNDLIEVEAGGHAAILFTDETRVVVPGDSAFRVSNYRFVAHQPEKGKLFFDVVKGAFRMVTGLVGRKAPQNVGVGTTTATIGIRGTSFDLACVPAGITDPEGYTGGGAVCGGGLYTSTRDGAISVTTDDGNTTVFGAGQSSYVAGPNQMPITLKVTPAFLNTLPGPFPEKIRIDIPGTFGIDGTNFSEIGLFVTVTDGRVVIVQAGREMLLGAGESGFASGSTNLLQRLNIPPAFLREDQNSAQQTFGFQTCRM
jgi:hypothetical protein